jgi:type I restriction enzyme S subunit
MMEMMKFERLGDIVTITSGGTPLTSKREYYDNGTIPWVKTGDLKVRHLSKVSDKITQLGLENSSAKIFPVNTVLVAMYGATIGACSILKIEAATNQACAALLPSEKINHDYLFFYLNSIKQELINKGIGGGQPNISATILKNTKV